jgi:hypothetical protein
MRELHNQKTAGPERSRGRSKRRDAVRIVRAVREGVKKAQGKIDARRQPERSHICALQPNGDGVRLAKTLRVAKHV